jgi:3-oxoacyl-[acyl-carrier-protein] synthase II
MRPLAVTGLSVFSPIGSDRDTFFRSLGDPRAARELAFGGPSSVLEGPRFAEARVAEVRGFDAALYLGDKGIRNFDRLTRMLVCTAKLALEDAGIKSDGNFIASSSDRVGVCAATAYGSLDSITEINRVAELEHPRYVNPSRFPNTVINSAAGYVAIWEGLEGPNVTIVDGNCGAADAVLTAATHIGCGRADALLVGGAEVLSEPLYLAFDKLGLLCRRGERTACFDAASRGTLLGEGAALLVLEDAERARARGARIAALVVGYGTAFEPPRSEAQLVHASEHTVARAVREALADAGVAPEEVDLVVSAASGVSRIDLAEEEGLTRVFGPDQAVIAPKSLWGESLGAAPALAMAASVGYLGGVPVGIPARGSLRGEVTTLLVMAMGYYGNVSAVVMKKVGAG